MSRCCVNCFKDSHIRETIIKNGLIGDCDFCSSKGVYVYDISETSNLIHDMVSSLVQIYCVSDNNSAKLLKESLRDDWDIFTGGSEAIQALVKELCYNDIENNEIFSHKVIIPKTLDKDFINDFGVVKGLSWKEFSDSIKYSNRFHINNFNSDAFASFLSMVAKRFDENTYFFRARIATDKTGFSCGEMYGPPPGKRCAGRVNPEGIGVIYLSLDEHTVLNEIRANIYDYVTIGKFKTKKSIRVVNLSEISHISPFIFFDEIERFAVNRSIFQEMSLEIAKPLRRNDSSLEYLPTQFISEYVKSQGYDGVEYKSTLRDGGSNLALFDESLVECVDVRTVEVTSVNYDISEQI